MFRDYRHWENIIIIRIINQSAIAWTNRRKLCWTVHTKQALGSSTTSHESFESRQIMFGCPSHSNPSGVYFQRSQCVKKKHRIPFHVFRGLKLTDSWWFPRPPTNAAYTNEKNIGRRKFLCYSTLHRFDRSHGNAALFTSCLNWLQLPLSFPVLHTTICGLITTNLNKAGSGLTESP